MSQSVPAFSPREFARVAWIFVLFDDDTERLARLMTAAKQDGFTMAVVFCRPDQHAGLRNAARSNRIPYVLASAPVMAEFFQAGARGSFSKQDYVATARTTFDELMGDRNWAGIYVADEPGGDVLLDVFRRVNISLAQDKQLPPAFSTFTDVTTTGDLLKTTPPVAMVDLYPFFTGKVPNNTQMLLSYLPRYNSYANVAASTGRDFWLVCQAFEEEQIDQLYRPAPNSMHSAQLYGAVMAGARGVVPFIYNSVNYIEGLRGPVDEPTRKHAAYVEFNRTIAQLDSTLRRLKVPELDARAPAPFAASIARSRAGNSSYVFVLNGDDLLSQSITLQLAGVRGRTVQDMVSRARLPVIDNFVSLNLEPGKLALLSLGRGSVAGYQASPARPILSTMELPVTHSFVANRPVPDAQPLNSIQLSDDASLVALGIAPIGYAATAPQIYTLGNGGSVQQVPGDPRLGLSRTRFLEGGLIGETSIWLGVRLSTLEDIGSAPLAEYAGHSGGAYDVVQRGTDVWISMLEFGLRRLTRQGGSLQSAEATPSEYDAYRSLAGPFDNASVAALIRDTGVHQVLPGAIAEANHQRVTISRVADNAKLSPGNVMGIPRHQRGVSLVAFSANGDPTFLTDTATEVVDASAVAWLDDDILAVADALYHVRFYRLTGTTANLIGTWRPGKENFYIRDMSYANNRLAVALHDGTVLVVDVSALSSPTQ